MADDLTILRELFNTRFDALDSKLAAMIAMFEKENDRQDEAIERIADRTTHINETRRLERRVEKLEDQIDGGRKWLNEIDHKVKIGWAAGVAVAGIFMSIIAAMVKGWIGV